LTSPTPEGLDNFGISVAAVGVDRVLIGAQWDDTGATDAGAAYLFSTNGTLLTTFAKPSPAEGDRFGFSLAAVGSDRVLIGAFLDDTSASDAGAAYLFSTTPTLAVTLTTTNTAVVSWPYPSRDFALEENSTLDTANWTRVANTVSNDGLFNRVIVSLNTSNNFFRLKKDE
jgi:hypothetical protein